MQQWIWIVVGVGVVVGLVLMVIEGRIMRKPDEQRTDREKRFIARDRRVGRANQRYQLRVTPWVCVGFVALLLIVLTPVLLEGRVGTYLSIAIPAVAVGVGMVVLWAWARRHRGADWRQAEDERNRESDAQGRPRWFISGRAGFWLGGGFFVLGAAITVMQVGSHAHDLFSGALVAVVGLVLLGLAIVQYRAEHRGSGPDQRHGH